MGWWRQQPPGIEPTGAELLDDIRWRGPDRDDPTPAAGRSRSVSALVATMGLALAIALLVILLVVPFGPDSRPGRLVVAGASFGQPFEMEWETLERVGGPALPPSRPRPMASLDPPCVGFGRPDWPEAERHPTVAHCADGDDLVGLEADDLVLVRTILAGTDTWHLFRFGVTPVEIAVELVADDPSATSPSVHQRGPTGAVLVPTGSGPLRLEWEVRGVGRHHCVVGAQPSSGPCS